MEFCFQFCLLQLNIPCTSLGAGNDMTGDGGGGGGRRGGVRFGQFKASCMKLIFAKITMKIKCFLSTLSKKGSSNLSEPQSVPVPIKLLSFGRNDGAIACICVNFCLK